MVNNDTKVCPFCSGEIKARAIRCKHCRSDLMNAAEESVDKELIQKKEEVAIKDTEPVVVTNHQGTTAEGNGKDDDKTKNKQEFQTLSEQDAIPESGIGNSTGHNEKPPTVNGNASKKKDLVFAKTNETLKYIAGISYALSVIFSGIGFHKMHAYYNPSSPYGTPVNAYVGGDAYNYIINANFATANFALATLCAIVGGTAILCIFINRGISEIKR